MCVSTRSLWGCSIPLIVVAAWAAASRGEPLEYEIGGPLAGVKLPPYPTQHGEPLGQPGVLLDTNDEGQPIRPVAKKGAEGTAVETPISAMPLRTRTLGNMSAPCTAAIPPSPGKSDTI